MNPTHVSIRSLFVSAALVAAAGCGAGESRSAAPAEAPLAVTIARAATAKLPTSFEAGGIVRARDVASVASRVLAPVAAVRVRPGDRVRAGQPLVSLDGRQLDADVRRASATLAAAEKGASAGEADVRGADAALVAARASRDRVTALFTRRSATPQERDDADAAFGSAEARVAGAQARAAEAMASVEAAKAAVDAASIAASYATIAAPFDGVVSERRADPGDMATPGMPLLTIENAGALQLEIALDEARASDLAIGQPVQVRFDSAADDDGRGAVVRGRLVEIGRVDAGSHSFAVKIDLSGAQQVRSGMFGRAVFEGPVRMALVVPASAVVRRGQLAFVFTAAENVARLRPVSVGSKASSLVEVTAGISPGEPVIANPPESLLDGARIK